MFRYFFTENNIKSPTFTGMKKMEVRVIIIFFIFFLFLDINVHNNKKKNYDKVEQDFRIVFNFE